MKRQLGILRNRTDRLTTVKKELHRKKNRFQMVGKEEEQESNTLSITTTNSQPRSLSEFDRSAEDDSNFLKPFQQARSRMKKAAELQKKMGDLTKARLSCLREKQNSKYDQSYSKLSGQATQVTRYQQSYYYLPRVHQDKLRRQIHDLLLRRRCSKIQEASRSLRLQEQEYFKRIKQYNGSTINSKIQLTNEQKKVMEGDWQQLVEEKQENGPQVGELVGSITRLTTLYKELGQLVVAQGSVIDRIDFNLETAEEHIDKGVVHLQGANQAASSAFADKVIKILVFSIILFALMLGIKYMK